MTVSGLCAVGLLGGCGSPESSAPTAAAWAAEQSPAGRVAPRFEFDAEGALVGSWGGPGEGYGSVWDIAFSRDPEQTYLFVADGGNERVWIVARKSLEILTSFGGGGRQPGQFFGVHSIATDSNSNVYTTETFAGKRV